MSALTALDALHRSSPLVEEGARARLETTPNRRTRPTHDHPLPHGLVLGKFYSLHASHSNLIRTALRQCDRVTVQLPVNSAETISLEIRLAWLQEEHPTANIVAAVDDAEVDFDSPTAWDDHMKVIEDLLDAPVDAAFTGDDYGIELARRLGAEGVQVDPGRVLNPVSGTKVRADPEAYWWALSPCVRAFYTRRAVILGAELTGTTTLAKALAEELDTLWVRSTAASTARSAPAASRRPGEVTSSTWSSTGRSSWSRGRHDECRSRC